MKKLVFSIIIVFTTACAGEAPEKADKVDRILYVGTGDHQPLVVGLGGSEGGNSWASSRWKKTRDEFLAKGYAFLAIGYFGTKTTAASLDRISIEAVENAIHEAAKNPKIDSSKIALVGGSKGAELALLLASHFKSIKCVVALVAGDCAFPALTMMASSSSWTYQGKEVPYVPMPWSAVPAAAKHDLRTAFEIMLEDTVAVKKARLKIEDINGPIFFLSATKDEMWPSTEMSNTMMTQLKKTHFPFVSEHIAINGGHTDVLDHFDAVFDFLERNFLGK